MKKENKTSAHSNNAGTTICSKRIFNKWQWTEQSSNNNNNKKKQIPNQLKHLTWTNKEHTHKDCASDSSCFEIDADHHWYFVWSISFTAF